MNRMFHVWNIWVALLASLVGAKAQICVYILEILPVKLQ